MSAARSRAAAIPICAALAGLLLIPHAPSAQTTSKTRPRTQPNAASRSERALNEAQTRIMEGRITEARERMERVSDESLPPKSRDHAAYLRAMLTEDALEHGRALMRYLEGFPRGEHRREAALALGKRAFALGEYAEAENHLSVFSPGVERDRVGQEGLLDRGRAQLAKGDAAGAYQFLRSADADLERSPFAERYAFALGQAALRSRRLQEALDAIRGLLERHPEGDSAPQALFAMGLCLELQTRSADAAGVFRQIATRFPATYEAARVRDRGIHRAMKPSGPLPLAGGFVIQVGAFGRRDLAEALVVDLRRAGVRDASVVQGKESPPLYRVRAGSFSTREEARAAGERLRRERGLSYNVLPR